MNRLFVLYSVREAKTFFCLLFVQRYMQGNIQYPQFYISCILSIIKDDSVTVISEKTILPKGI